MLRVYVDANIFLNSWFSEGGKSESWRRYADQLFKRTIDCQFFLVISDLILHELSGQMSAPERSLESAHFGEFRACGKLKIVKIERNMHDEARRLVSQLPPHVTHTKDAIHAIVAKKEGAVLVTRNIKDYRALGRMLGLKVRKPEWLISNLSS